MLGENLNPMARGVREFTMGFKNAIFVRPGDDVKAKYDWIKSSNRNSVMGALSATNRRSMIFSPGKHTLTTKFIFDTDYITFVSSTGEGGSVVIGCSAGLTGNVLSQTADDIRLIGITFVDERTDDGADYWDINCSDNSDSFYSKIKIILQFGFTGSSIKGTSDIGGTWESCDCGYQAWMLAPGKELKAIMRYCVGGERSFGGDQVGAVISGRFEHCYGGLASFGGCSTFGIDCTGIFIGCIASNKSFALAKEFSGIAIDCIGGLGCFAGEGGVFSGIAINCIADIDSFGLGAGGTQSGKLIDCRAGLASDYALGNLLNTGPTTVSYSKIKANMTTSLVGDNNDLVYTAKLYPYEENNVGIQYIDDRPTSGINVTTTWIAQTTQEKLPPLRKAIIIVHFKNGEPPTATEVKAAIDASAPPPAALVTISNAGGNDGSGTITVMDTAQLTGGKSGACFVRNHPWKHSACDENTAVLDFYNGHTFTNEGATGEIEFTLPAAAPGLKYSFVKVEQQNLLITPNGGDTIDGAADMDNVAAESGKQITIACFETGKWITISKTGTWA